MLLDSCFKPSPDELTVPSQIPAPVTSQLLPKIKRFFLNGNTNLEPLSRQLKDRSQQRVLGCNKSMKKMLAELVYLLSKNRNE